ncbi:MAG: hypothetical protein LUD72_09895, partial [Bacteroidales bacterium]|nr:hypothetical protein [Bacteroidales bacterium]
LKYFDFNSFNCDSLYGEEEGHHVSATYTMLAKAIASLVFSDVWQDFTYESMDKHKYVGNTINTTGNLFGFHDGDNYRILENLNAPQSLRDRVARFGRKENTIGNIMVIPSGWGRLRDTKALGRCYTDVFLKEVHKMMTQEKKFNWDLVTCLALKKNEFYEFRTEENFQRIVRGLMLEDFLDEAGQPKQVFMGLFYWEKNYTRDDYIKAAEEYLDFCEPFIDRRADRIIERLQTILG